MIGRLTGILREKNPPQVLLDVGGIGYEVDVPMSTFYSSATRSLCARTWRSARMHTCSTGSPPNGSAMRSAR